RGSSGRRGRTQTSLGRVGAKLQRDGKRPPQSCASTRTSAAPSGPYLTTTNHGLQQTGQSSTYSCRAPLPGSRAISTVSPQYGHCTTASVSAVPSPSGKAPSSG